MRIALSLLALLLSISPAAAADLPVRKATPIAAAPSWSGFYVGINGGMNLGAFNPAFGTGDTATAINLDDNSPVVGGHMGYLMQTGGLVVGPEIGMQYWGLKSEAVVIPATTTPAIAPAVLLQQKIDWIGYAGVRAGIAIAQPILVYATGGFALGHQKAETEVIGVAPVQTETLTGWYAGFGVELMLTEKWSLGAQYKHIDFGDVVPVLGIAPDRMTVDQITGRLTFRLVPDRY